MIKNILMLLMFSVNIAFADTVKLVVPLATGATMDDIARVIAPELAKKLNKTVIVENRPGAGGTIAMEHVANSAPDGLTLVVVNNGLVNMSPVLNSKIGYTSSSFTSLGLVGVSPLVLVTGTNIPANNLKELIEYVKTNPAKASWASPGIGTNLHLLGELLNVQQNLDMVHILYRGMAPAMIDVAEGRVTMMFDVLNPKMTNFFEVNKMKPIAVTSPKRIAALPNTLTVSEQGYAFLNTHVWFGVSVPANTPEPVLHQLRTALSDTLEESEIKEKLKKLGLDPANVKSTDAQKYIDNDRVRWTRVIKQSNIKVE